MSLPAMVILLPRSNVRSNGALMILQNNNNLSNSTNQHHSFLKIHASLSHKNVSMSPLFRSQMVTGGGSRCPYQKGVGQRSGAPTFPKLSM